MTKTTTQPQVHGAAATIENLRQMLITEAANAHQQYPQYEGYWDSYRVAEVTKDIRTKMGVAFKAGELVLVAPETRTEKVAPRSRQPIAYENWPTKTFATAYSRSNGIDTSILASYVREVRIDG